ncbi:MAG TPA: hypothetical protein VFU49_06285 [Ktedonobacteraceae bacterium]|nr:hypothetical protein [Ktedonobacteraceae bacterium]
MFTKVQLALSRRNVWQVHGVTLALLVLFVGGGSQVLANAAATGIKPADLKPIKIMAQGKMISGDPVKISSCIFVANERHSLSKLFELNGDDGALLLHCNQQSDHHH